MGESKLPTTLTPALAMSPAGLVALPDDAGLVLLHAPSFRSLPPAFPLRSTLVVIGREAPPGGIVIPLPSVSRVHGRIAWAEGGWRVTDLGSRNGIILNGRRVREATLEPGAVIAFGDAIFKFVHQGATAHARYRIDGVVGAGTPVCRIPGAVGGLQLARISAEIDAVAGSELPVLLHGESGTGKELAARALHAASSRRGELCAVNCAAMPLTLIESELFGHVRGAFTGATQDRLGVVRRASGGTLFLDEIGDMPLEAQAKLLRLLETREVMPVGGERAVPVDVRFVCATHRDLAELVAERRFRGDLLARLAGATIRLPPLRARKEDLFALVRHFTGAAARGEDPVATAGFYAALLQYDWPYNVRELQAAIRRAMAVAAGAPLELGHMPLEVQAAMKGYGDLAGPPPPRPEAPSIVDTEPAAPAPRWTVPPAPVPRPGRMRAPERDALVALLSRHEGNVAAVARELDREAVQIRRWLRQHGIDPNEFRPTK